MNIDTSLPHCGLASMIHQSPQASTSPPRGAGPTGLYLHTSLWPPPFQCCAWHAFPQYTTTLHREHGFRVTLSAVFSMPQLAHLFAEGNGVVADACDLGVE